MKSLPVALVGAQEPRHRNLPRYSSSAGQEAADLAAEAGLILDPWQRYVLEHSLGEREDGRWSATEVGLIVPRQNGKGSIIEARELAGLFLFGEKLIMHSAHEFKTATEGFRRVLSLIEGHPALSKRVLKVITGHGNETIELKSGARLRFVARSRGSGRGFSGDCVILDEAYNLSDAAMDALMPTLSARPNAQIWLTSSAPLPDSEVLRRLCIRGRAGEDERLAYFEWCADDDQLPTDPAAHAQANPAYGIRLTAEFTAREQAALSPEGFARERLGRWQEHEKSEILPHWTALADPKSQISGGLVFALDVSPARSTASIAVAGRRDDGLKHVEVVECRAETHWILPRLRELHAKWGEFAIVIDERSAANSMKDEIEEIGLIIVTPETRDVADAAGRFYDSCSAAVASLRHLGQPVLQTAVDGAVTRPLGDAWTWDRRKPDVDITPLVAVTLAAWAVDEGHADFDIASQVF